MNRIERHLLRWLQHRCKHPGNGVIADILQRDNLPTVVSWCATCGAYSVHPDNGGGNEMRRPEPTWSLVPDADEGAGS